MNYEEFCKQPMEFKAEAARIIRKQICRSNSDEKLSSEMIERFHVLPTSDLGEN